MGRRGYGVDGKPLESVIQAGIVKYLKTIGCVVWEMQKGSAGPKGRQKVYCTPGIPDLYVLPKAGKAIWLEVKRPHTGQLSKAQKDRHAELSAAGVPIYVVRSIEEAREALAMAEG